MKKVIEVVNLVKTFGKTKALDNVSFEVYRGEIFAYLGPNGAGKTTTVEILEGIRKPTSGKVLVLEYDVVRDRKALHNAIGVLPQNFSAFDRLTVRENVELFCNLYDSSLSPSELIELVGLEEKENAKFYQLSGGLRQRVGIAVALAGDPEIVFLDEPTTGLDPKSRRDTWKLIEELKKRGKTIFLTTHYMEEAEALADRVAIIVRGRIVALDTPEGLIRKFGGNYKLKVRVGERIEKDVLEKVRKLCLKPGTNVVEGQLAELLEVLTLLAKFTEHFDVELIKPTLEEAFLKLIGARISEEGEPRSFEGYF